MTKRLSAVVGEYTDKQTNQQKAEWQNVGVLITGKNGKEYALLDPSINLAGVLLKQNVLAQKKNEQPSDMVMTSVFDEQQNNSQGQNNNQGQQQSQQQGGYSNQGQQQQAPRNGGFGNNDQQGHNFNNRNN